MKASINNYEFHRAFEAIRPDNFSCDGLDALFTYFEDLEKDAGIEIELDVIAICCDFIESTVEEFSDNYHNRDYDDMETLIRDLNDETLVIPVDNDTFIYQAF